MTEINIVDPPMGEVQSGEAQAPNPSPSAPIGVESPPAVPVVVQPPVEPTSETPAVIAPDETQEQLVQAQEKPAPAKNEKMLILGNGGTPLPEGPVNFGMSTVNMPNEEAQKSGFAIPAELVGPFIAQFQQYKFKELRPMGT